MQCRVCLYSTDEISPALKRLIPEQRLRFLSVLPPRRRKQSVLAEALLRLMLSDEFGVSPETIVMDRTPGQKPRTELSDFSLSHTLGASAAAVGPGAGIDMELIRKPRLKAAAACFTPQELDYMSSGSDERFWEIWTRKEALFKSLSSGAWETVCEQNTLENPFLHTLVRDGFVLSVFSQDEPDIAFTTEEELTAFL